VLLALLLLAGACGGDDDNGGEDPGETPDETPGQEEGTPTPGGSVTYGLEAETNGGFCLAEAQLAIAGIQVARTIYDTLTAPLADGSLGMMLAESVEPNDDYTEWTITLKDGIQFHDGTPLDAEIVRDNLLAYAGKYPARSPLLFLFVFENLDTVEATGPLTVVAKTKTPWTAFPWYLWSSSRLGIMARAQLDAPDPECANNMIGTGPFTLDHWTVNTELVATKNDSYWMTDPDGNKLPYLDEITYKPIAEIAQRVNALESGQIDIMHTSDTEQIADRLRPMEEGGDFELFESDSFGEVNYIMLNSSTPPFNNKNARLAVAHAIDREFLRDARGGGLGELANGPFQADVVGYVEDTGFPTFDLAEAERYAGIYEEETGEALEFTYSFVTSESGTLTAQEIQTQMDAAGITMNLNPTGDQATAINEALAGEFQAIGWRNHPGADPDTQYVWWYRGSPVNFGRIDDPEITRLLDEGRSAAPEERQPIYEELNRRFGEEVWNLWGTWTIWGIANAAKVNGVLGNGIDGEGAFEGLATGHYVTEMWVES
jgi:peptide/nickel transport system substrate-binding protein